VGGKHSGGELPPAITYRDATKRNSRRKSPVPSRIPLAVPPTSLHVVAPLAQPAEPRAPSTTPIGEPFVAPVSPAPTGSPIDTPPKAPTASGRPSPRLGARRSIRHRGRKPLKHRLAIGTAATALIIPPQSAWYEDHWALHGTAMNPDTGQIAEYSELSRSSDGPQWIQSNTEEFGRLAQGLGPGSSMPTGTNTLNFIHPRDMPADRIATYLRIVCADRPEKTNPIRVRHTIGGDRIDYPGNTSTKTADMTTAKTLCNSVISTRNARFMTGDLKEFYLGTPLNCYEYICIPLKLIPQAIIELYNLLDIAVNGYVWAEVRRGMYGLPQAGILANQLLQRRLALHGYRPVPITPGLWKHDTRDVHFTLVVDDFGVKYTQQADAEHLMKTLTAVGYKVSEDWTGSPSRGITSIDMSPSPCRDMWIVPCNGSNTQNQHVQKFTTRIEPTKLRRQSSIFS
jgi:hypothetical protein